MPGVQWLWFGAPVERHDVAVLPLRRHREGEGVNAVLLVAIPAVGFTATILALGCCVAAGRADQRLEELRRDGEGIPQGADAATCRRDSVASAPAPIDAVAVENELLREVLRDCKTWVTGPAWLRQDIEDVLRDE